MDDSNLKFTGEQVEKTLEEDTRSRNEDILEAALRYERLGWSIIPVGSVINNPEDIKKPLIRWTKYQEQRATPEEIREWFQKWPHMGIAAVCGEISGIIVLDLDVKHNRSAKELAEKGFGIPPTACARTGSGGEHYVLRYDPRINKNFAGSVFGPGVDLRSSGGYFLLAPSRHPLGTRYEWMVPPEDGIADVPEWLVEAVQNDSKKQTVQKRALYEDVGEGQRNTTLTSICGKILRKLDKDTWESLGWIRLQEYNETHCNPPVSKQELRGVFDSIAKTEQSRRDVEGPAQPTQATQLVELITSHPETLLFLDQYKNAHVRFRRGDHFEIWPCDSSELRYWLADEYFQVTKGKVPGIQTVSNALSVLEGRARAGEKRFNLQNRIAEYDGAIWYDLCDEKWRAVRIDKQGWAVVTDPPILFRRHTYHKAQVEPIAGGDIHEILKFVNIKSLDQQRLFLAHLVSSFIPGFPHAILYVHGPAGSAKSSFIEINHELVDPSHIGSLSLPRNVDELKQMLNHHSAFASFDNVSTITDEASDLFCRAVTNAGFSKRRLYTNDEDYIYRVQANVAINGINLGCHYQDLLDRSLLMELERVNPEERQEMRELWEHFQQAKPRILGAILNAVVKTLDVKPVVKLEKLHRMGDYVAWGCAISAAIGESQNAYLAAFEKNIDGQNESVLNAYDEATLLLLHMETRDRWEGTATALLGEFRELGKDVLIDAKELPKNGQALSRQLNILKPALEAAGYRITQGTNGKERTIVIKKIDV